jgi:hypothetical protein
VVAVTQAAVLLIRSVLKYAVRRSAALQERRPLHHTILLWETRPAARLNVARRKKSAQSSAVILQAKIRHSRLEYCTLSIYLNFSIPLSVLWAILELHPKRNLLLT